MTISLIYPIANDKTGGVKPRITQVFGARPEYYAQFGLAGHEGVDYGAVLGQPVWAAASGRVIQVKSTENPYHVYGIHCWLDHGNGYWTAYCHLSKSEVQINQFVNARDRIGLAGSSGNSTGPHLHFNLTYKGASGVVNYLNPELYYGTLLESLIPADAKNSYTNIYAQNVRVDPSISGRVIVTLSSNTRVYITGVARTSGDYRWLEIASGQSHRGVDIGGAWIAESQTACKVTTYGKVGLL